MKQAFGYYLDVFRKYATFTGRARRSEYWYFVLFNFIASFVLAYICAIFRAPVLINIYTFAIIVPSIACAVRRMHDCDKSGWFAICPIYNLILLFTAGTPGPNRFGPDPKSPETPVRHIEPMGKPL